MKTILVFLIIFSIIVVFHEFGHFIMAKRAGVLVREFAIGMGPKLFQYHGEETAYTLRLLPLGGYVRMAGLEEYEDELAKGQQVYLVLDEKEHIKKIYLGDTSDNLAIPFEIHDTDLGEGQTLTGLPMGQQEERTYVLSENTDLLEADGSTTRLAPPHRQIQAASLKNRLLINIAGPFNNFLLGILGFMLLAFLQGGVINSEPVIGEVVPDSPAAKASLQPGDRIRKIDDTEIEDFAEIEKAVSKEFGRRLNITYERQGAKASTEVTVKEEKDAAGHPYGLIGIKPEIHTNLSAKMSYGLIQARDMVQMFFSLIGEMFTQGFSINNFGGPVYMYQATSEISHYGFFALVSWTAALSINLGLMNLLPIPALDGGKILFNLLEGVLGRPISAKMEGVATLVGAVLMLILMLAVTWNDIMRFF